MDLFLTYQKTAHISSSEEDLPAKHAVMRSMGYHLVEANGEEIGGFCESCKAIKERVTPTSPYGKTVCPECWQRRGVAQNKKEEEE